MSSTTRSPCMAPSSVANQSNHQPSPQCCCFSARFVNLVLFIFNFIFLLSGVIILLLTLLYGRPEVSQYLGETAKYLNNIIALLGSGHLVQIIHYSMLFCGIVITALSLLAITSSVVTSWARDSDHYYYKRKQKLNENESLLINSSTLDSSTSRRSNYSASGNLTTTNNHHYYHYHQNNNNNNNSYSRNSDVATDSMIHQQSCLSRCAHSPYLLCCYIFVLLLLFTIQLVIGLLSVLAVSPEHVFIASSITEPNDDFLLSIRESVNIPNLLLNRAAEIEPLYTPFRCCGWLYFDDYEYLHGNRARRNKTAPTPDSCCKTLVPGCGARKHPNNIYYDGCWSKFGAEMRDYVLLLGWTALSFAVVELIGLLFAVCHYVQTVSRR